MRWRSDCPKHGPRRLLVRTETRSGYFRFDADPPPEMVRYAVESLTAAIVRAGDDVSRAEWWVAR